MRAAVDVGFGYVKAAADHGARWTAPAVLAPADGDAAVEEAWGAGPRPGLVQVGTPDGGLRGWLVGDAALHTPGATRPWAAAAVDRAGYDVLVAAALAALAPPGADAVAVDLALGLPLGQYGAQRAALAAAFRDRVWVVQRGGRPPVTVRVGSVLVLPQAAGAYYAAALRPDGTVRDAALLQQPAGVVDVGFRTVDYFVMHWDADGLRPVPALSGSLDGGVGEVYEAVRRRVTGLTGQLVDALQVETALRHGGGLPGAGVADLGPWANEAAAAVGRRVADQIRQVWTRPLLTFGAVLLAGGGALLLAPALRDLHPATRVVPDPAFANAVGFLAAQAARAAATA